MTMMCFQHHWHDGRSTHQKIVTVMLENRKITSKYNGHPIHSFSALYRTYKFLMVVSCRLATILVDSLAVTRPAGSVNASRYFAPVAYGTSPLPPRNTVGAFTTQALPAMPAQRAGPRSGYHWRVGWRPRWYRWTRSWHCHRNPPGNGG